MRIAEVMKKRCIIWCLLAIVIVEGCVIVYQQRLFHKFIINQDDQGYIEYLEKELRLERKGLRNDDRSGNLCPACDSKSVAEIRYGYWKSGMWEAELARKEIVLGGCIVGEYSKRFYCNDCGYKWGPLRRERNYM